MCYDQSHRQRTRKAKTQVTPAMSAGEAIERMLVERKISTKINYDVLRDLANGLAKEGCPSNLSSPPITATTDSPLAISKAPPSHVGRLPSLTTRKRNFSTLMAESGTSSQPPFKSVGVLLPNRACLMIIIIMQIWMCFSDNLYHGKG